MATVRAVLTVLRDVLDALRPWPARLLAAAVVLQVLYWTLATPGPTLAGAPRSLATALATVGWGVALLLAVPLALLAWRRDVARSMPFGLGDWRLGLGVTAAASAAAVVVLWFAAADPAFAAHYPLPGAWPGESLPNLLAWAGLYTLYYVAYEAFYRGFLLRTTERLWGVQAGIWVQALASTLIHVGKPLPEALAALPYGLFAGALAVRSRSLVWPILIHVVIGLATDVIVLSHQGTLLP